MLSYVHVFKLYRIHLLKKRGEKNHVFAHYRAEFLHNILQKDRLWRSDSGAMLKINIHCSCLTCPI